MPRLSPLAAGRVMMGVGAFGVVAALAGTVIGYQLIGEANRALARSLALTAQSLTAIDASLEVAEEVVVLVDQGIAGVDRATQETVTALEGGEELLGGAAELARGDIAEGLDSVNQAMPALIQVAAAIDRSLSVLSLLPLGVPYDPDEPFDQSLRDIQDGLSGLPDELRAQAELLDDAGASMGQVGTRLQTIADDLSAIDQGLSDAREVLGSYAATASGARDLVEQAERDLARQVRLAQVMVITLGLTIALGQMVPLYVGSQLLQRGAAIVDDRAEDPTPPGGPAGEAASAGEPPSEP